MSGYTEGRKVGGQHVVDGYGREDYFWLHVDRRGDDECWPWTASTNTRGYGWFGIGNRRTTFAHRYSFELHHEPLDGRWALHTCDNPPCVNPRHLYAGTVKENVRDMLERGRHVAVSGEDSPMAKLTDEQVREIRRRFVPGLNRYIRGNSRELADEFGVSQNHIRHIVAGVWRRSA